jgi:hypothetical protein
MRWLLQHKTLIGMILLGLIVLVAAGIWLWGALVGYVDPGAKGATDRKDVVQVFALIVAGVVGLIGGIVGIVNLSVSLRNVRQQFELEDLRRQDAALQAYFEQMGDLLTDHDLIKKERDEIRQLARAQTLTVLARLDGPRKGSLVRFLYGAGLIRREQTVVRLDGADLTQIDLEKVILGKVMLGQANLRKANLRGAELLDSTDLSEADLEEADLTGSVLDYDYTEARYFKQHSGSMETPRPGDPAYETAHETLLVGTNLRGAKLHDAKLTDKQLAECESLEGAIMPNGQRYEDWLKSKGRGEDGENSGRS